MKVGRKPPEARTLLVKTGSNQKSGKSEYDLYAIEPEVIAKLSWDGKATWFTEDDMRFQGAQSAIDYTVKTREREGAPLTPGRYQFPFVKADVQEDRIVLKTEDGRTLIIRSGKEL